jgi:hypothetical protein
MILLDKLCKSKVNGFNDYVELMGWFSESSRFLCGDLSGTLVSGSIKNSDLVLITPNGEHGPKIEQQLYIGKFIKEAIIVRLGWIQEKLQTMQKITFKNLRIVELHQNIYYIITFLQIWDKENDIQVFDAEDGKAKGHAISTVNFSTDDLTFK